jgi:hypothetical protein
VPPTADLWNRGPVCGGQRRPSTNRERRLRAADCRCGPAGHPVPHRRQVRDGQIVDVHGLVVALVLRRVVSECLKDRLVDSSSTRHTAIAGRGTSGMNSGARSRHLPPPRRPPPAPCPPSSPLATAEPSGERVWLNGGRRPGRTVETLTGRVNQLGEAEPVQRRAAATSEAARHPRSRAWRHAGTASAAACSSSTRAALRSRNALRRVVAVDESALGPGSAHGSPPGHPSLPGCGISAEPPRLSRYTGQDSTITDAALGAGHPLMATCLDGLGRTLHGLGQR